jgi:hypothetical protein
MAAPERWNDVEDEARRLAGFGLGWEDLFVCLRHLGFTKQDARRFVFGDEVAHRMLCRDIVRDRKARAS